MMRDTRVTSPGMIRLLCKVSDGVFSHERLIRILDATGEEYTALVDADLVGTQGQKSWVGVVRAGFRDDLSLIALPTDGSKVWVPSAGLLSANT